jgi:transposase
MRPFGTSKQLKKRRQRALTLLRHGQTPKQVAQRVGTTARSVRRWQQHAEHSKLKHRVNQRPPGRPSRLLPAQIRRLFRALEQGAYEYGYAEDYWSLDRITHLIWDFFRVRYHPSSVWHILQRAGWSCQKPQRRSLARDDQAIANWKHYVWPRIKKVA